MVPVNKTVQVLVVGADVIHSFSVPAFGIKIDAVPGRTNSTWFKATQTGTFYGQCSQLCGTDHSYMPIEVKVVSQADFDAWVASKTTPSTPATNAAAPTNSTAPAPTAAATPATPVRPRADRSRRVFQDYGPRRRRPRTSRPRRRSRRACRPCAPARLLHPLVPVDQPQGYRHALHHLRDLRGADRDGALGPDPLRADAPRACSCSAPAAPSPACFTLPASRQGTTPTTSSPPRTA
ncbi:MAG: hypothetical protein WDM85_16885 [Caulobacteraceae bacterium]